MLAAVPYRTFPEVDLPGPLPTLHTFGLLVGLGVLVGIYILAAYMDRVAGVERDTTYRFAFWVVLIGFVVARLTFVITYFVCVDSRLDFVAVWKGGLYLAGGFIAGIFVFVVWHRRYPEN